MLWAQTWEWWCEGGEGAEVAPAGGLFGVEGHNELRTGTENEEIR